MIGEIQCRTVRDAEVFSACGLEIEALSVVITSYSIHYTKLYDGGDGTRRRTGRSRRRGPRMGRRRRGLGRTLGERDYSLAVSAVLRPRVMEIGDAGIAGERLPDALL